MNVNRSRALIAALVLLSPGFAMGQAAQCSIDYGKPGQVKDANNALAKAALFAGKIDQLTAATREALSKLQKDEAKVIAQNPVGRAMVLGNIFTELAGLPDSSFGAVNRGAIGLLTSPTETIDLVAAADSMYDLVEAAMPECRDETEGSRRRIYAAFINRAVNLYNEQNVDSALALAERGLSIYEGFPLGYIAYNIRGNALQAKDDLEGATASFMRMTDLMKGDTSIVDERKSTMINVANLMMSHAESQEDGPAKNAKVAQAISFLEGYLKEFPGDGKAEGTLARAQIMSGDAGAAERVFGTMASNPDRYTDVSLFEAGVSAARSEKPKEAVALFEAGLKKNAYSRDALFNIALTLQKMEKWTEADSYLRRLVAVDPENPEVYQVFALNYQGLARIAKDAAAKKPDTSPEAKAYSATNDSLLKYFTRYQEAPAKVTFNLWSHDGPKHVLAGTVENLSAEEKSYTLKFDFLNANGEVVTSKEVSVAAVASKASRSFRLEVDGEGVLAFKYAPLN